MYIVLFYIGIVMAAICFDGVFDNKWQAHVRVTLIRQRVHRWATKLVGGISTNEKR